MNICYIGPQVIAAVSGGLWVQAFKTGTHLKQYGVEVQFFNPWEKYDWKKFSACHIFRADFETLNICRYLNDIQMPFVVSPVFFNAHNHLILRKYIQFTELIQHIASGFHSDLACVKQICSLAHAVCPNSDAEAEFITHISGIDKKKVYVIPNGVDERFGDATADLFKRKYGLSDFILTVGHFSYKRKNLLALLEAIQTIDHPTVIIGSLFNDHYSQECKQRISKLKQVLWIDHLKHNDPLLASAYAASKVFVLPSFIETPGLTALEAASAGATIVITPHGGTRYYFQDHAVYIVPQSVKSIADGLISALKRPKNPLLQEHIKKNFLWKHVAEKTAQVYTDLFADLEEKNRQRTDFG